MATANYQEDHATTVATQSCTMKMSCLVGVLPIHLSLSLNDTKKNESAWVSMVSKELNKGTI